MRKIKQQNSAQGGYVLITRPESDSVKLSAILQEKGYACLNSPLLSINFIDPPKEFASWLKEVQALVMTSANGVRALLNQQKYKDTFKTIPVYAVGDATATEARNAGFKEIHTASGDVDALAELIIEKTKADQGPLLHVAGSKLAGDLAGSLEKSGFTLHRAVLYEAQKATSLSEETVQALLSARVQAVLFYSPRTSENFSSLVQTANLGETLKNVTAFCLSQNVANKLDTAIWHDIQIAKSPTQKDLLELLDASMGNDDKNNSTKNTGSIFDTYTAEEIIEAFGGIRPTATKLNAAVSTVQGWKTRNHIPDSHRAEITKVINSGEVKLPEKSAKEEKSEDVIILGDQQDSSKQDNSKKEAAAAKSKDAPAKKDEKSASADKTAKTEDAKTEPKTPEKPEPVVVKKRVSTFSILGVSALAIAMVLQPYWAPAITKVVDPVVAKFAPNLAAAKGEDNTATTDQVASLESQLKDQLNRQAKEAELGLNTLAAQLEKVVKVSTTEFGRESEAINQLNAEIKQLQENVDTIFTEIESQPVLVPSENGATVDLSPLQNEVATVKKGLINLEKSAVKVTVEVEKQISAIRQELISHREALETQMKQDKPQQLNTRAIAVLVGVMELSDDLHAGRPILKRLSQLQKVAGGTSNIQWELDNLKSLAESGIPTFNQLHKMFATVAANPIAHNTDSDQTEWVEATVNNLQNLISIRRIGDDETAPPISRAEAAMARGDLEDAVAILTTLKDEREDVTAWLVEARKLKDAEISLAKIREMASNTVLLIGGSEQITGEPYKNDGKGQ